jgi:hypothetical protein
MLIVLGLIVTLIAVSYIFIVDFFKWVFKQGKGTDK